MVIYVQHKQTGLMVAMVELEGHCSSQRKTATKLLAFSRYTSQPTWECAGKASIISTGCYHLV